MSAFEDFVQQELPKRGYLNSDVAQETVIIRRGTGPRQFDAVTFTEGQILGLKNGVLQGVSITDPAVGGSGLIRKFVQAFTNQVTWTITHNSNSENVIVQAFDEDKYVIIPNSIQVIDANVVELTFNTMQTGTARAVFLD